MKPAGMFGIILIAIGIILLAYGGYTSFTTKENVAKLGPIAGGVCLVGGIILVVTGNRRA